MLEHVEHLWTILCRGVTKDESGLSLIGLIDMVHLPQIPAGPELDFECCVLSYWRRNLEPGTTIRQRLAFEYCEVAKRWVLDGEDEIVLTKRHLFCAIRQIHRLPIGGYGQHMFVVQRQDRAGGEWIDVPPTAGLWLASDEMIKGLPPAR
ncbi:MAG TPA: hypothetical protein VGY54_18255 [Polyangiaceae bacterium]|jgi:hypothetical protein|nr:hypothetical protein [Polyangiaceae bacterium]